MNLQDLVAYVDFSNTAQRDTQPDEIRVDWQGVATWYRVPMRQLTEFKHALRNLYGGRVVGRLPHYTIEEK